jgi:hypothetical protein
MKKNKLSQSIKIAFLGFLCLATFSTIAQIPIKTIRKEVKALKTEEKIEAYWTALETLDQKVLMRVKDQRKYDSISISNMVKAYYLWDYYKEIGFIKNSNVVPILNLSHSAISEANVVYWPILEEYYKLGGGIASFGGKNYSYPLESISLTYFHYSVVKEEQRYPNMLEKLKLAGQVYRPIPDRLNRIFLEQNELRKLTEIESIGSWQIQPFPDMKEEGCFELLKMSDNNLYLKKHNRIQKLELIQEGNNSKIYRIETEPFGWTYILSEQNLKLIDESGQALIEYSVCE